MVDVIIFSKEKYKDAELWSLYLIGSSDSCKYALSGTVGKGLFMGRKDLHVPSVKKWRDDGRPIIFRFKKTCTNTK